MEANPQDYWNTAWAFMHMHPPRWLQFAGGLLFVPAFFASLVALTALAAAKITEAWITQLRPKVLSPEERQRAARRKDFADYLNRELEVRDKRDKWRDEQFAELEAEVQVEGRGRKWFFGSKRNGRRREPSLSLALERSAERIILLEGDPGSGKSVALRHVARAMAERVIRMHGYGGKLPIYINLKEIKRPLNQVVDHKLILNFVLASLNRSQIDSISEYLDQNFKAGIVSGEWVFLFDAFDEIPDILSSTEIDATVTSYSDAISDFLGGINRCRGVVASRIYRGPAKAGWHTFRILDMSPARQASLIRRSLPSDLAERTRADLITASDDVRLMARNPLLLGLLCEHVKSDHAFPLTAHETIARFIDGRFLRDERRIREGFSLETRALRAIAEAVAFSMTADFGIGLSPQTNELAAAVAAQDFAISRAEFGRGLEALNLMQLGRLSDSVGSDHDQQFTFTHRRFQEFFATCVVIDRARLVTASRLLTDARWRETAVVLLQTGARETIAPLLDAAASYLPNADPISPIAAIEPDRVESVEQSSQPHGVRIVSDRWSPGQLHVLGILQAGTAPGSDRLPDAIRKRAGALLKGVFAGGDLLDRKLALEVASVAPQHDFVELLKEGLATQSQWLSEIVYGQTARLVAPVPEIYDYIRANFWRSALSFMSSGDYQSTRYFVSRLPLSNRLLQALLLARMSRWIDLILFPTVVIIFFSMIGIWSQFAPWCSILAFALSCVFLGFPGNLAISGAVMLRYAAFFLIIVTLDDEDTVSDGPFYFLIAGTIYAYTWLPAALINIQLGRLRTPLAWPFVQVQLGIQISRVVILALINPMMLGIILVLALIFGWVAISNARFIMQYVMWFMPLLFIEGAIFFIPLTIVSVKYRMDMNALSSIMATTRAWSPELFQSTFSDLRTIWGRVALLQDVVQKPLSGSGEAWEAVLSEILDAARRQLQYKIAMWRVGIQSLSRDVMRARRMELREMFKDRSIIVRLLPGLEPNMLLSNLARKTILQERDLIYKLIELTSDGAILAPLGRYDAVQMPATGTVAVRNPMPVINGRPAPIAD